MSLWCDRYRPKSFKELDYNVKQADQLQRMVKEGDFPHLLVWGTNGAGKVNSWFESLLNFWIVENADKLHPSGVIRIWR